MKRGERGVALIFNVKKKKKKRIIHTQDITTENVRLYKLRSICAVRAGTSVGTLAVRSGKNERRAVRHANLQTYRQTPFIVF